ncbi:UPF0193 protein EVG1-like [Liolophura sinensis]|uniref:UPF0193 protein EVG1-like n=1 Tax=Liolophura sinensis TaxID=3198878 RepID=UPI003158043F
MASNRVTRVAQGGFWSSQTANYSKETQSLLKEMMKESKLTNFQQRHLENSLRKGSTLPLDVPPTFTPQKPKPVIQKQPSKVINVREYSGGIRSKDTMERRGDFEKPDYKPPPRRTRSAKEKIKLANIMAYGEDLPPPDMNKIRELAERKMKVKVKVDRFDELQKEIDERRAFLADMEKIGKASEYRPMIETEISQKIRDMEIIDKKKCAELQKMLDAEKAKSSKTEKGGIPEALAP